jgi:hypothetical protein
VPAELVKKGANGLRAAAGTYHPSKMHLRATNPVRTSLVPSPLIISHPQREVLLLSLFTHGEVEAQRRYIGSGYTAGESRYSSPAKFSYTWW